MKVLTLMLFGFLATMANSSTAKTSNELSLLKQHTWNHGARFCLFNNDPAIEIYQYNESSFILRQNKCLHYEAPFIYVLFGEHSVFVQDTGATASPSDFPLYQVVMQLVKKVAINNMKAKTDYSIIVSHSHSHGDHIGADKQFKEKDNVVYIAPTSTAVKDYFAYGQNKLSWPEDNGLLDLGGRKLTIVPIPGHQSEALAIYDDNTQWLLTGDSLYPGRIYIKSWDLYKASISRLADFTKHKTVSAIMGTHIEMSKKAGVDYPMGSTYQPNEALLPLTKSDLLLLDESLKKYQKPQKLVTDNFIVYPID